MPILGGDAARIGLGGIARQTPYGELIEYSQGCVREIVVPQMRPSAQPASHRPSVTSSRAVGLYVEEMGKPPRSVTLEQMVAHLKVG